MAIETTYFTGTTADANKAEVLAWLTANATDYFDTIFEEENTIKCKIGEKYSLFLNFNENSRNHVVAIMLKNDAITWTYPCWATYDKTNFTVAKKTSGGLFLSTAGGAITLFITKSINGDIFYSFYGYQKESMSVLAFIADFDKSASFTMSNAANNKTSASAKSLGVLSAGKTALVPAISDAGTYSENLFFVPYTQFAGQSGITIEVDGTKYIYDGVFALKE